MGINQGECISMSANYNCNDRELRDTNPTVGIVTDPD
uniref:Cellulose synthase n=1 Tax=Rhizophora mucronata TaxID=61149 RepID=A0A2P2IQS9_RHIMU